MRGLKLGRQVAVNLKSDADFNQYWRCPGYDGSVLRLALPLTATLLITRIAKETRYKSLLSGSASAVGQVRKFLFAIKVYP